MSISVTSDTVRVNCWRWPRQTRAFRPALLKPEVAIVQDPGTLALDPVTVRGLAFLCSFILFLRDVVTAVNLGVQETEVVIKVYNRGHWAKTATVNDGLVPHVAAVGAVKVMLLVHPQSNPISALITLHVKEEPVVAA